MAYLPSFWDFIILFVTEKKVLGRWRLSWSVILWMRALFSVLKIFGRTFTALAFRSLYFLLTLRSSFM